MIVKAYAKINLYLKITGKRTDGYHLLESKMQALPDLYDILEIVEADKTEVTCSDAALGCGEDNLVCKALKALGKSARVHIEKRIPVAAGLGGGSADAAAVLFAFGGSYEDAARLGADVPFSLMAIKRQGNAAAIATGTGTELCRCEKTPGRIITKTPHIAVSTPAVYREYDNMISEGVDFEKLRNETGVTNDLQFAALRLFPEIQNTIDELKQHKDESGRLPLLVQQSGSGPTCFAIYGDCLFE